MKCANTDLQQRVYIIGYHIVCIVCRNGFVVEFIACNPEGKPNISCRLLRQASLALLLGRKLNMLRYLTFIFMCVTHV